MNNFLDLFQGFAVIAASDPMVVAVRTGLVLLGFALIWLGRKGILEPLADDPHGTGNGNDQRLLHVLRPDQHGEQDAGE